MDMKYSTSVIINGEERDVDVFLSITDILVIKPNYSSWDSPEDYYGTREVEWEIEAIHLYDEHGELAQVIIDKVEIEKLGIDYDKIEIWIWEKLEEMKDQRPNTDY